MKLFRKFNVVIGAFCQAYREGTVCQLLAFSARSLLRFASIVLKQVIPALFWKGCVWILSVAWCLKLPYEWVIGLGIGFVQKRLSKQNLPKLPSGEIPTQNQ